MFQAWLLFSLFMIHTHYLIHLISCYPPKYSVYSVTDTLGIDGKNISQTGHQPPEGQEMHGCNCSLQVSFFSKWTKIAADSLYQPVYLGSRGIRLSLHRNLFLYINSSRLYGKMVPLGGRVFLPHIVSVRFSRSDCKV